MTQTLALRRGKVVFAAALAITAALVMSACSSSGNKNGGSGPGTSAGATNHTITVGLESVLTGPYTALGALANGAKAYLDNVNDTGGVDGYKYKLDIVDNGYTGPQTVTVTKQLINQDHATAIIGIGTVPIQSLQPIASSLNATIFMAGDGHFFAPPQANMFDLTPDYLRIWPFAVHYVQQTLKNNTMDLVYSNDGVGLPAESSIQAYAKTSGAHIAAAISVDGTTTDCAPYAARLKSSGAPVVIMAMNTAPSACIVKADKRIGYNPTYLSHWGVLDPAFTQILGSAATGVYAMDYQVALSGKSAAAQEYKSVMSKLDSKDEASAFAEQGWDLGAILNTAVKAVLDKHESVTVANLNKELSAGFTGQPVGMLASVTFDSTQHYSSTKLGVFKIDSQGVPQQVQDFTDLPKPYGSESS